MNLPAQPEARYELVLTYLLHRLPQDRTSTLDSELLSSAGSLALFEEALADALDAYADGTLGSANRQHVEELAATRPAIADKVRFARELKMARDASSTPRRWGSYLGWAAAIAAMLLVSLFLWTSKRQPRQPAVAVNRPAVAANAPAAFTVILSPAVLRGANDDAVTIPANASAIRLQALLPPASAVTSATLRISRATGETVRQFDRLTPQTIDGESYVEVTIPAGDLPPGGYTVALSGPAGDQVARYRLTRLP